MATRQGEKDYRIGSTGVKHWCEHCRCWTQPDPLSIRAHEGGSRHKDALKRFLIEQRKRKVDERRAGEATSRALAEIAAAAGAAVSADFAPAAARPRPRRGSLRRRTSATAFTRWRGPRS